MSQTCASLPEIRHHFIGIDEAEIWRACQNSVTTVCSQYSPCAVELSYRQSLVAVPTAVAYETLPDSVGIKIVGRVQ
jgi:hypothetical protein